MNELAVAIILLVTGFLFSLELRRRRLAEMRLQETLASVEQQVADRTEALSKAMAELKLREQELHLALDERAAAVERAETARQVAEEANHLKDEFLATASHELRTPLNAIVGWVHVLQTGALSDEAQRRQAVNAIDRNAKVQTRLIEDLLDVSRMIKGRVSLTVAPLDLRSVVDAAIETVRPAAAAKEIAIDVAEADDVLPVIGDEHRLQQVVWNLLANALKYTPRGGRIEVASRTDGDWVIVAVTDNGEGITPEFLPHVFEPFRQGSSSTMRSGLGLGLAIVRRLVELHG